MNTELRRRLYAEATALAERHPADLGAAVARGQAQARSRVVALSAVAAVLVLAAAAALVVVRLLTADGGGNGPAPTVIGVTVSAPGTQLAPGTQMQATATAALSDGTARALTDGVAWASSDAAVVTVDGAGLVRALGEGTASVTAQFGGFAGSAEVAVVPGHTTSPSPQPTIVELRIDPKNSTVEAGQKGTFRATFYYSDTSSSVPAEVEWTSSNPKVGTIEPRPNGEAVGTALAAGTATLRAVAKDPAGTAWEATATVTVKRPAIVRITIEPAQVPTLFEGDKPKVQLKATIVYKDGTTGPGDLVQWASSDAGIVEVDTNGWLYPQGIGTAAVTASQEDATSPPVSVKVTRID